MAPQNHQKLFENRLPGTVEGILDEEVLAERTKVFAAIIVVVLHDLRLLPSDVTCLLPLFLAGPLLGREADRLRCDLPALLRTIRERYIATCRFENAFCRDVRE